MIPAMFGLGMHESKYGKIYNEWFQDYGYVTSSVGTMCCKDIVDIGSWMRNFVFQGYDHEFYSFMCDPNLSPSEADPKWYGPYSFRKKCMYGKQTVEWAFEYANKFLEAYKDYPKLLRIDVIDNHEGSGEVVKYDDEFIYKFLVDYEKNGHLKDSIIFTISDHNFNREGFYDDNKIQDWYYELTLPHLSLIMDKNIKNFEKYKENLIHNENIFVTPFDFHSSILSLLQEKGLMNTNTGQSFFYEKFLDDIEKRSCSNSGIDRKKQFCRCGEEVKENELLEKAEKEYKELMEKEKRDKEKENKDFKEGNKEEKEVYKIIYGFNNA